MITSNVNWHIEMQHRCPNDGCVIPLVKKHRDWPRPRVRFYWCRYCEELFAFVGENEFGGRLAASFARDPETDTWRLGKPSENDRDLGLATAAVARVEVIK